MLCQLLTSPCWDGFLQDETQAIFHEYDVLAKLAVLDELAEEAKLLQDGYVQQAGVPCSHQQLVSHSSLSFMACTLQGSTH